MFPANPSNTACTLGALLLSLCLTPFPASAQVQTTAPERPMPAGMPQAEPSFERRLPPAVSGSEADGVGLTAEMIHQGLEDQIVAGVARPRIDLNIEFAFASAELTEAGRRDLDQAGDTLSRWYLESRFMLGGHTDDSGPAEYNMSLSLERAQSARRYLIEKFAIAPDRLATTGHGESQPLPGATAEKNRRVVLEMLR